MIMEKIQLERLKKIVAWAYEKSAFYYRSFQSHGVTPDDIKQLSDISKLPILTRADLESVDAFEFLTLPLSSIVRINDFGRITKFYTVGDIRNNVEMLARTFIAANVLRGSIVGIAGDLSDSRLLDALYALESIGATVIPLKTFPEKFGVETLVTTSPNFLQTPVAKIFYLNEKEMRPLKISTSAKIFNLYAPPEIGHAGLLDASGQFRTEHFLVEDRLIITTLTAQAMPLIRFKLQ